MRIVLGVFEDPLFVVELPSSCKSSCPASLGGRIDDFNAMAHDQEREGLLLRA